MKRLSYLAIIAIVMAAVLTGCQTQPPGPAAGSALALAREQLIEKINANNQQLSTLWTRTSFDAEIRDPETNKRTTVYADDGTLQYRSPGEIRIRATKVGVGLVLDVGLNNDRFWLAAPSPGPDVMWWGFTRNPVASSEIPIRPQDVLQVLAITPIQLGTPDAPGMQFDPQNGAYTLSWYRRTPGGFTVTRQIVYDRQTLLPNAVRLFDPSGHLALRARLSKHREVDGATAGAKVATEYEVYLPPSRSTMELRLRSLQMSQKGAPNDASFRFPQKLPVAKEKRVDAQVSK